MESKGQRRRTSQSQQKIFPPDQQADQVYIFKQHVLHPETGLQRIGRVRHIGRHHKRCRNHGQRKPLGARPQKKKRREKHKIRERAEHGGQDAATGGEQLELRADDDATHEQYGENNAEPRIAPQREDYSEQQTSGGNQSRRAGQTEKKLQHGGIILLFAQYPG